MEDKKGKFSVVGGFTACTAKSVNQRSEQTMQQQKRSVESQSDVFAVTRRWGRDDVRKDQITKSMLRKIPVENLAAHLNFWLKLNTPLSHSDFTIRIIPVAKLDANSLKEYLLEVITTIKYCGGRPISIICDNCPLNQRMYKNLATVLFKCQTTHCICIWFCKDRVFHLYARCLMVRLLAVFEAVKDNLEFQRGTVEFFKLITSWFKMMNVKDRYSYIKLRDDKREPWKFNCESFKKLEFICNVISTCKWQDTRKRCHKLTKFTADAFVVTSKFNIAASTELLSDHHFRYVIPAVFSQDPLEKFFGQARQRFGGNFYIDISDVIAAANVQRLHQLLKLDIIPKDDAQRACINCTASPDEQDLEMLQDITTEDTENLIQSDNCLKHKIIFVAGFLTCKYQQHLGNNDADDAQDFTLSSDFTQQLDREGLSIPKLSTVYLVHSAVHIISKLSPPKASCRKYVSTLLSYVDAPLSNNTMACRSLVNILLKAHVIHHSDREQELGCLRRRKKLQ
ncbi:hypothetical protein HELRODRAFT_174269 [Helobdella robusta]|uniref:Uncharacterized protein n=1 Tax=Helobdella robusta TaxID=6412 RepID=T1F7X0_HELRO|nr:hypothetical protein HELRODRAFT_174269 [Helobdella robusta]ESO02840.1 hypothetical protein HELRODRAFT_174269 [Helobdella robusta]